MAVHVTCDQCEKIIQEDKFWSVKFDDRRSLKSDIVLDICDECVAKIIKEKQKYRRDHK